MQLLYGVHVPGLSRADAKAAYRAAADGTTVVRTHKHVDRVDLPNAVFRYRDEVALTLAGVIAAPPLNGSNKPKAAVVKAGAATANGDSEPAHRRFSPTASSSKSSRSGSLAGVGSKRSALAAGFGSAGGSESRVSSSGSSAAAYGGAGAARSSSGSSARPPKAKSSSIAVVTIVDSDDEEEGDDEEDEDGSDHDGSGSDDDDDVIDNDDDDDEEDDEDDEGDHYGAGAAFKRLRAAGGSAAPRTRTTITQPVKVALAGGRHAAARQLLAPILPESGTASLGFRRDRSGALRVLDGDDGSDDDGDDEDDDGGAGAFAGSKYRPSASPRNGAAGSKARSPASAAAAPAPLPEPEPWFELSHFLVGAKAALAADSFNSGMQSLDAAQEHAQRLAGGGRHQYGAAWTVEGKNLKSVEQILKHAAGGGTVVVGFGVALRFKPLSDIATVE